MVGAHPLGMRGTAGGVVLNALHDRLRSVSYACASALQLHDMP